MDEYLMAAKTGIAQVWLFYMRKGLFEPPESLTPL